MVSIVDVYDALTSERCYKKAFDHDTAIQMILDGQCGQFNPILLKCLKELSIQLSKMSGKEMDDNKHYHEIQRLSNEIPVSYTHLDVYKRQVINTFVIILC